MPKHGQRSGQAQPYAVPLLYGRVAYGALTRPRQNCSQVVMLPLQAVKPVSLGTPQQFGLSDLRQAGEILSVPAPKCVGFSRSFESLQGVLADALEESVPLRPLSLLADDYRFVHQLREQIEHLSAQDLFSCTDGLRRLECPAPGKH